MITTADLAKELNTSQRNIQNRIMRLLAKGLIKDVQRAGNTFVLSHNQAQFVRNYSLPKKGSK